MYVKFDTLTLNVIRNKIGTQVLQIWATIAKLIAILYAKQEHLGCKKRRGQSEAAVIWLKVYISD